MNGARRERLNGVLGLLHQAESIIDQVHDEEKDSLDNVPENLQLTDRFIAMENAVDYLEDAIENVQEATRNIESAVNAR